MMSGLMGSMASGMATGVGMSVANRAVDSLLGPRQTEVVHKHGTLPETTGRDPCIYVALGMIMILIRTAVVLSGRLRCIRHLRLRYAVENAGDCCFLDEGGSEIPI